MSFQNNITPYICVRGAARAIDFYKTAFGAVETMRLTDPAGRVGHAEMNIGSAKFMLADEFPEMGFLSPESIKGTAVTLSVEVEDVDATAAQVVAGGATVLRPVADQFYGRRSGQFLDPFGHRWDINTVIETLSDEEITRRAAKLFGGKEQA